MWLACHTQDEIAEAFGCDQDTVSDISWKSANLPDSVKPDASSQPDRLHTPALQHLEAAGGLLERIWIHPEDGSIIDGRNRYRACIEAGIETTTRTWNGDGSLVEFVLSLNLHRRHLDASQRACAAAKALPKIEEEARARQIALAGTRKNDLPVKLPEGETGEAREHAAKLFGVSPRYVSDAKRLIKEERREGVREENRRLVEQAPAIVTTLDKKYQTIVLDPPWESRLTIKPKQVRIISG